MPFVNPGLTKGQTRSKSSQNNIFHGFISNLNSLEIFGNFDQVQLDRGHLKMAALQSPLPRKVCRGYKRPQAPPQTKKRRRRDSLGPALCLDEFFAFLLSSKHKKTHQSLLILLFTKNTRYCYYTQSSFSWFYTLDLGFRGVDVAF